jgi:hypothetical protein
MSDLRDFAQRVERLCDFILNQLPKDGTPDVLVIQTLKEDAADIQHVSFNPMDVAVSGLYRYMKGDQAP